jgi:hypothetical protein
VVEQIAYARLRKLLDAGAELVEVLPEPEFAELHLPGAVNIPLSRLDRESTAQLDRRRGVAVYCWEGIVTRVVEVRDGTDRRVLVRWFGQRMERGMRVPNGVASMVVTVRDGRTARMQDCAGHAEAIAAAGLTAG